MYTLSLNILPPLMDPLGSVHHNYNILGFRTHRPRAFVIAEPESPLAVGWEPKYVVVVISRTRRPIGGVWEPKYVVIGQGTFADARYIEIRYIRAQEFSLLEQNGEFDVNN
ncbi:Hypothetical protein FKW44_016174 [Caligus rogercresseyi]|uniref:Uncharacterized protein n=1 Tax=Caligus rogercresseyi TaxID=217165 RepID=A0A7T8H1C0_CALRO|nr:Hypothetical protein FKW44_016174 [Caligus rogercresseyi]